MLLQALCGLVAISVVAGAQTLGGAPTCNIQAGCVHIEITPASSPEAVCSGPACRQFKACFWWEEGASCAKTGQMSHSCVKQGCQGNLAVFTKNVDEERQEYNSNDKQCQIGPAGSSLYFLLKDGAGCSADGQTGWLDYFGGDITGSMAVTIEPGSLAPQDVECRPRPEDVGTCTGNGVGEECIWRVDLPTTDNCVSEQPPSDRERFPSKTSVLEQPSPNPSPSPEDEESSGPSRQSTCCPVDEPCNKDTTQEQAIQDVLGDQHYFTATLPNCPDQEALDKLRDCCECEKDPVCNLIICKKEVPQEILNGANGVGAEECL